eukprot:91331_1
MSTARSETKSTKTDRMKGLRKKLKEKKALKETHKENGLNYGIKGEKNTGNDTIIRKNALVLIDKTNTTAVHVNKKRNLKLVFEDTKGNIYCNTRSSKRLKTTHNIKYTTTNSSTKSDTNIISAKSRSTSHISKIKSKPIATQKKKKTLNMQEH